MTDHPQTPPPPPSPSRRIELAPLVWVGVGLVALAVELVGTKLIPPAEDEPGRAVWLIGSALLHAAAILLGILATIALPDRRDGVRRVLSRLSVAIFGFATLASHGWAVWIVFARVHAPAGDWLRLDPIVDVVGGLYVAFGWLAVLTLVALAAGVGRLFAGSRPPA